MTQYPPISKQDEPIDDGGRGSVRLLVLAVLALALIVVLVSGIATVAPANAAENSPDAVNELARLPEVTQPVTLSGACDRGVAVFSVHNTRGRWASRGLVQVVDASTGQVLRERSLIMGEGQTASFRVDQDTWDTPRYRLMVTVPDLGVSYVKTFGGACPPPVVPGR